MSSRGFAARAQSAGDRHSNSVGGGSSNHAASSNLSYKEEGGESTQGTQGWFSGLLSGWFGSRT